MTYEEKYKAALERARALNDGKDVDIEAGTTTCEYIFPELKEDNNDERIRKGIIELVKQSSEILDKQNQKDMIAWLEKQGEHKSYGQRKECEDCQFNYAGECKGYCALKRNEQKPTDKVESKFKVGDWVILNGVVAKILDKQKYGFVGLDIDGKDFFCNYGHTDSMRLWTIQDAKDGDVLVDEYNNICLYSGAKDDLYWHSGIYLGCDDCLRAAMGYHKRKNTKPATKEQRDLLFSKMKQEGYEWRQEEKKLIKMKETKFKVGDWVVNSTTLNLCHILKVEHGQYICDDCSFPITNENEYHLWTIADAKDGDILAVDPIDGYPFSFVTIYKERALDFFNSYCFIGFDGKFYEADEGHSTEEIHPATKEQRDLLFQKIKQAGYEWDAEKKELKKIEPKLVHADFWDLIKTEHKMVDSDKVIAWLVGNIIDFEDYVRAFKKDFGL